MVGTKWNKERGEREESTGEKEWGRRQMRDREIAGRRIQVRVGGK